MSGGIMLCVVRPARRPPAGYRYLVDGNGAYLVDEDGKYLIVAE